MDLRIDFASLTSAAGNLQGILDATERSSTLAQGTTLGAGYSGMPELSALGAAHGAVLTAVPAAPSPSSKTLPSK